MTGSACVLGAGGVLGAAICAALDEGGWDVTAFTRERPVAISACTAVVGGDRENQRRTLERVRPQVVVDLRAFDVGDIRPFLGLAACTEITWINISSIYAQIRLGGLRPGDHGGRVRLTTATPPAPSGPYGEGKLACERFWARSGARVVSVRLPFVVGRGDRSGRVRHYASLLRREAPVVLPEGGSRHVPLIYSGDVASFVHGLALGRHGAGTVQLAVPSRPLGDHLAELAAALGATIEIVEEPAREPAPYFSYPVDVVTDSREAKRWLPNWKPTSWKTAWNAIATELPAR